MSSLVFCGIGSCLWFHLDMISRPNIDGSPARPHLRCCGAGVPSLLPCPCWLHDTSPHATSPCFGYLLAWYQNLLFDLVLMALAQAQRFLAGINRGCCGFSSSHQQFRPKMPLPYCIIIMSIRVFCGIGLLVCGSNDMISRPNIDGSPARPHLRLALCFGLVGMVPLAFLFDLVLIGLVPRRTLFPCPCWLGCMLIIFSYLILVGYRYWR